MFRLSNLLILISILFSSMPCFAVENQDIVSTTISTPEQVTQFNDEIRKTTRRLRAIENGISLTSGVTGILPVANGGWGRDSSTVSANTIPYFSSTGVIGNIGIGTTGQVLTVAGSPVWATPGTGLVLKKISNSTVTISSGTSSTSSSVTLDSTSSWTSKSVKVVGEICESSSNCTGSTTSATPGYYSGSATAFSSLLYANHTCVGTGVTNQQRTFIGTSLPSISESFGNGCSGSASCSLAVSSGNLVLTASRTADGSGTSTTVNCEFSGTIIREQ